MKIDVVHAFPDVQYKLTLELPEIATVQDALNAAAKDIVMARFDWTHAQVGVWGEVVERERKLADGDRLEVYRELTVDPMQARRERANRPDPAPDRG